MNKSLFAIAINRVIFLAIPAKAGVVLALGFLQTGLLSFSTTAPALNANICSTAVGVQTLFGGKANNPKIAVTLSFATTGTLAVYSDSACTNAVTTATIGTSASSTSFYLMTTAAESDTLTVTATGYRAISQAESAVLSPYTWTGLAGDNVWSSGANWLGGTAPSATQIALFDASCTTACSPHMTASTSVGGVKILSAFTGTITQNSGSVLTIGSQGGWNQQGGTFVGSSSGDAINLYGYFLLTGGSFTSTSGTLTDFNGSWALSNTPTFIANNGTIFVDQPGGVNITSITGATYNNFSIYAASNSNASGTVTIAGTFTLNCGGATRLLSGGQINVAGNVSVLGYGFGGTTVINLNGAANQTLDPSGATSGNVPSLTVTSTGGTVTLKGSFSIWGNYIVSSGTVSPDASGTIKLYNNGSASLTYSPGTEVYNNVAVTGASNSTETLTGTLTVSGSLTVGSTNYYGLGINGGTITVQGNVTPTSYGARGTTVIKLVGSGTQTIDASSVTTSSSGANLPALTIASTGTVSLVGTVAPQGGYVYTSGILNAGTSTLYVDNTVTTTVTFGSPTYYNVVIVNTSGYTTNITTGLSVSQNLTLGYGQHNTFNFPSSGGPYAVSVGGALTVGSLGVVNFHGATVTEGNLVNNGTINN